MGKERVIRESVEHVGQKMDELADTYRELFEGLGETRALIAGLSPDLFEMPEPRVCLECIRLDKWETESIPMFDGNLVDAFLCQMQWVHEGKCIICGTHTEPTDYEGHFRDLQKQREDEWYREMLDRELGNE